MKVTTLSYDRKAGWSSPFPSTMDSRQTLVLVFGASEFVDDPGPIADLAAAFPSSCMAGCSSAGEILGATVADGTLAVAVAQFEHTRVAAHSEATTPTTSFAAGRGVGCALSAPDLRALLVFSDGLHVNGTDLVAGLNDALPPPVVITGGLAGDGDRFKRTWVLVDGKPADGRVVGVGLYGDRLHAGHGSKGGWDKFGPERVVTRSEGNVLYELDGKPALALYKEYLGERAGGLPATGLLFPLAIREGPKDERSLVRTILAVDEAHQSMTFAGDVPGGWLAQLMKANLERLIGGASEAALMAKATGKPGDGAALLVAVSCVGRRLVLGQRVEEELEATRDAMPPGATQIGFYSYGELSPFAAGRCDLHNQTMTMTSLTES